MVYGENQYAPHTGLPYFFAMATVVGFFNGWVIANIKMPPLIVTLSTMTMLEGLAFIICGGVPIFGFPQWFTVIGQGYLGPIPIPGINVKRVKYLVYTLSAFLRVSPVS
jgi:ribose/xylose/arabinose/galactoside ABC-type transport system permease subunit